MSPMPVALLLRTGSRRAECLMSGASLRYRHGQSPCSPSRWTVPAAHVTTPPSLHSHASVVAGVHSDIFSHCHWCSQFCNRHLLLHFSSNDSYSFLNPLLLLWHRERAIKLNRWLKEELEVAPIWCPLWALERSESSRELDYVLCCTVTYPAAATLLWLHSRATAEAKGQWAHLYGLKASSHCHAEVVLTTTDGS